MEKSEQPIGAVAGIVDYAETYNMFWMEKRFIMINTTSQIFVGGGLIPELVGEALTIINKSRKEKKAKNLTTDELLEKDSKSFAVNYVDIEKIELHDPHSRWKKRKLKIKMKEDMLPKEYGVTETQFAMLSALLPSIAELKGKLIL